MPSVLDAAARACLARHRVARLATADADGVPHLVPLCYARVGDRLVFVVDAKPKRRTGRALKRMRNIAANPAVAFLVDDYADDWRRLAFLLVHGTAAVIDDARRRARALAALRARYPQYRAMDLDGPDHPVVAITPLRVHAWRADAAPLTPRVGAARSRPRDGGSGPRTGRPSRAPRRRRRLRARPSRAR